MSFNTILLGIAVLLIAGLCQGSFGLGYKEFKPLTWEGFWGIYSVFCIIVTLGWAFIKVPAFYTYLTQVDSQYVIVPIICGALWGITAIGFSKAVVYIGMSLVYGLSMGVSAVVGSIIPLLTMEHKPSVASMISLAIGMIITLVGITVITKAGICKGKEQEESQNEKIKNTVKSQANESKEKTGSSKLGIMLALFSGLGSGAMNIGFNYASDIGKLIIEDGYGETGASAIQWLLVLVGGCLAGCIYCAVALTKNRTWSCYKQPKVPRRFAILFGTSIIWFMALATYGVATLLLGDMGTVIGWTLFNALALVISNLWGIRCGEWNNTNRAKRILLYGNLILIVSWIFIGVSGAL